MYMTGLALAGFALTLLAPVQAESPRTAVHTVAETGGPKNKGNARNRGNYWSTGKAINSGNFSNVIDSPNSNNTYGGSANNVNGPQRLRVR